MVSPLPDAYVWPLFAGLFLLSWAVLYAALPAHRAVMRRASALTASFGLTQPLFVPAYWSPPGLFGLAARTGFDVESVVFAFAVGGVGAVLLAALADAPTGPRARRLALARPPGATLALPFVFWMGLTATPLNPIHACLGAMAAGLAFTLRRRPDLMARCAAAGGVFTLYYGLFLAALGVAAPGYFTRVWNPAAIWGPRLGGAPLEEALFACLFGAYGAGVYEQIRWLPGPRRARRRAS
jgi:Lycopene cyclase